MSDIMKKFQLNMYLRHHPNRKRTSVNPIKKESSGVRVKMDNQEKEITIIGAKEPKKPEEHMASEKKTVNIVPDEPKEAQDDFLLSQIDEFRVKAQQLQKLLRTKEEKAKELQQIVNERSDKAEELQQLVNERQEQADGITAEVAKRINYMAERVDAKLEAMDQSMARLQQEAEAAADRRLQETNKAITQMAEQVAEVKQVSDKLDTVKTELSDKIHSESVQSYRNTQELLRGIDEKMNKVDALEKEIQSVRRMTGAIIALTVIDILGVAAAVVLSLGIF